jgi:quercetin dioxygenase-like cupin family protein
MDGSPLNPIYCQARDSQWLYRLAMPTVIFSSSNQANASTRTAMKRIIDRAFRILFAGSLCVFAANVALAQDPTQVDAKHYKVTFENEQVRVLHITYGPHEKSVMHDHPNSIAVFLTDGQVKFSLPDGKTQEVSVKAGQSNWNPAGKHLPENMGDKPFEVVLIELKK